MSYCPFRNHWIECNAECALYVADVGGCVIHGIAEALSKPVVKLPTSKPMSSGSRPPLKGDITEPQKKAIFAISKSKGMDHHEIINSRYGKASLNDLTKAEASTLIDELQKMS